jgi:hypothetical protein
VRTYLLRKVGISDDAGIQGSLEGFLVRLLAPASLRAGQARKRGRGPRALGHFSRLVLSLSLESRT